jgi:hypothetical protein
MTQTTPTTTLPRLPARVDSALLARHRRDAEPLVLLKLVGVGNTAPYDFHDKGTRSYIFRFESAQEGHILRVPLHLWQAEGARLAHDIMDQRRQPHALIVFLDMAAPATAPAAEPPAVVVATGASSTLTAAQPSSAESPPLSSQKMGATDTSTETRIVVGPGSEPTVAPTLGQGSPAPRPRARKRQTEN